ncbi:MAG: hypothetical protein OEV85_02870 [Candidatus Thorarchaeota archaeon]|nr:hypothetical protein [Candidatus Thorarchaeota archaeon]
MISGDRWKLVKEDSTVDEFIDIRRKVGNQVIRAYLLKSVIESNRVEKISGKLRGPKGEFKDFSNFLILNVKNGKSEFRVLAESGVYENLRIVATDSRELAQRTSDEIIKAFTNALEEPEPNNTILILSKDSKIQ